MPVQSVGSGNFWVKECCSSIHWGSKQIRWWSQHWDGSPNSFLCSSMTQAWAKNNASIVMLWLPSYQLKLHPHRYHWDLIFEVLTLIHRSFLYRENDILHKIPCCFCVLVSRKNSSFGMCELIKYCHDKMHPNSTIKEVLQSQVRVASTFQFSSMLQKTSKLEIKCLTPGQYNL